MRFSYFTFLSYFPAVMSMSMFSASISFSILSFAFDNFATLSPSPLLSVIVFMM